MSSEPRETKLTGYAMGMPKRRIRCLSGRPELAASESSCFKRVKTSLYVSG
jgi:hypothetical protein